MFLPMRRSSASSSGGLPRGPASSDSAAQPPRRNIAAGRRLAPLPPSSSSSLQTERPRRVSSAQSVHAAAAPSPTSAGGGGAATAASSTMNAVATYATQTRTASKPRATAAAVPQRRLTPVALLNRHSSSPASRRLFAETAPTQPAHRTPSNNSRAADSGRGGGNGRPASQESSKSARMTAPQLQAPATGNSLASGVPRNNTTSTAAGNAAAPTRPKPRAPGLQRSGAAPSPRADRPYPARRLSAAVSASQAADSVTAVHDTRTTTAPPPPAPPRRRSSALAASSTPAPVPAPAPAPVREAVRPRVDFPLAPHDMEARFYADRREWATAAELPALVSSLLDGASLEPRFTTALWTQAYAAPDTVPQPAATHDPNAVVLPPDFQHREAERRTQGFYACVRCNNPICDPAHQVVPTSVGLRGAAVFEALHLDGVELCVQTPSSTHGGSTAAAAAKTSVGRLARQRRTSMTRVRAGSGSDRVLEDTDVDGGLRFVVHCRHCGGCLGEMRIGEAAHNAATQALFCANSACLEYMPYRTRAPLGQGVHEALPSGSAAAAEVVEPQAGITLGALFGQRGTAATTAWGPGGDASDGSETSFEHLLAELDTRRPAAGQYSDGSDEDGDDGSDA